MTMTSPCRIPGHECNVANHRQSEARWVRRAIGLAASAFLVMSAAIPAARADACLDQQKALRDTRAAHRELDVELDILLQVAKSYPEEHHAEGRRLILGAALLSDEDFSAWASVLLQTCQAQALTSTELSGSEALR